MELIQAIDNQYLGILQDIFNTRQWLHQNEPLGREIIKMLCPKVPATKRFRCVFCPDKTFEQSTKAVEHIEKHLGLHPFDCMNWCVGFGGSLYLSNDYL